MPAPALLAGVVISQLLKTSANAAANLYKQENNRDVYQHEHDAYAALNAGYNRYLERQGLQQNPNRSWNSYFGKAYKAQKNIENSWADTADTVIGLPGRFLNPLANSLYDSAELSRIYNRL